MNEADSENIAFSFKKRNVELTQDIENADIVVVNTCTVRQHAEDKAMSHIGLLRKWKEKKPERKIFVVGCAAEKLGVRLIKIKFPFVDEVIGAKSLDKFDSILSVYFKNQDPDYKIPLNLFNSPFSAYVTIMRGCSLKCSYCIVPHVRGEAVDIDVEEIIKEVKIKTKNGAKEIILLGQTVNSYRFSKGRKDIGFSKLLKMISEIDEVKRIRFISPHPLYFDEEFFELFKNNPKIARHIHLPVQSGSDRILKLMKRGYTRKGYLELIDKLKNAIPDVAISTDFIVGFPTETEEEFKDTLSLAVKGDFSYAFCFKYSARTNVDDLQSTLSRQGIEKRLNLLLGRVKEISKRNFHARIGKIEEVLFETENSGRSSANFKVKTEDKQKPGEILMAEIREINKNILYGRVLK